MLFIRLSKKHSRHIVDQQQYYEPNGTELPQETFCGKDVDVYYLDCETLHQIPTDTCKTCIKNYKRHVSFNELLEDLGKIGSGYVKELKQYVIECIKRAAEREKGTYT